MAAERQVAAEAEFAAQMMAGDPWGFGMGEWAGGGGGADGERRFVTIRRDRLLQDGFERLNQVGVERLRGRVRIQYIDEHGA